MIFRIPCFNASWITFKEPKMLTWASNEGSSIDFRTSV